MTTQTLRDKAKDIFCQVCELSESEQEKYIAEHCVNDHKLITEVKSLLGFHGKAHHFFDHLSKDILGYTIDDDNETPEIHQYDADPYLITGTRINHYQVLSNIGSGGMGVVYKAEDTRLKRMVALKFLPPSMQTDEIAIRRFLREATTASRMDHINIGTIYSVEQDEKGRHFIAMAYYEGETLETKLAKGAPQLETSLNWVEQICNGLQAAHQCGVIHRDIKPANIILLNSGCIKILDFGLAKASDDKLTQTGIRMGTLAYLSPEYLKGQAITSVSDIWSLGVLFFELLSGHRPFTGTSDPAVMHSILNERPDIASLDVSLKLKNVLAKCLNKNEKKRLHDVKDLSQEIQLIKQDVTQKQNSKIQKIVHSHFLAPKRLITFILLLITVTSIFTLLQYNNFLTPQQEHSILSTEKSITVLSIQNNLSDFESGLLDAVSQSLIKLSSNNSQIWVVPQKKARDYQVSKPEMVKGTFGTRYIIDTNLLKSDEKYSIKLDLIDAQSLEVLDTATARQSSSNPASLQMDIDTQLLKLLQLSQLSIRKQMSQRITSNPEAYKAFTLATGILERADKKGNLEKAIKLLESALVHDPKYLAAMVKLADSYQWLFNDTRETELAKKAEKLLEKVLSINSTDIASYISLGKLHSEQGRPGTALASYQLALHSNPDNIEIYEGMAQVYEKTNRIEKAEEFFLKTIEMTPDNWDVYNNLGAFYIRQSRYQDAVMQFSKVIELTPSNAWGYSNLGAAYWYLGDIDKAINNFEKSLLFKEDYALYKNIATLYYYQHNFTDSIKMYQKALSLNEADYQVWGSMAVAAFYAEEKESFINSTFDKAIELALIQHNNLKQSIEVSMDLAYYFAFTNDIESSDDYLQILLSNEAKTGKNCYDIASIFSILKQDEKAIGWLKKSIELHYSKQEILNSPDFKRLLLSQSADFL